VSGESSGSGADGEGTDADANAHASRDIGRGRAGERLTSSDDARDTSGDDAGTAGSPISALERIVIGSVGITTRALAQAAPDVELTFSQWRALLILGESPTGHRVGEVAARVGVTLPATSRLLRRLGRRGLVSLAPDEADRRATRATLTANGARVRDAIIAFRRAALRDIAEHSGAGRRGLTGTAIDSLARSFERYA